MFFIDVKEVGKKVYVIAQVVGNSNFGVILPLKNPTVDLGTNVYGQLRGRKL